MIERLSRPHTNSFPEERGEMPGSPLIPDRDMPLARQRLVDRLRIKTFELFIANQDERQRAHPQAHKLLYRLRIARHVLFRKLHALLR